MCGKTNDQKGLQDVSVSVYKILSCIRQMNQAFNREMIIATLRGRGVKNGALFQLGLHRLAAYGSLVRYSEKRIDQLLQSLFDEGALWETKGRYKAVKLSEAASAILLEKNDLYQHK